MSFSAPTLSHSANVQVFLVTERSSVGKKFCLFKRSFRNALAWYRVSASFHRAAGRSVYRNGSSDPEPPISPSPPGRSWGLLEDVPRSWGRVQPVDREAVRRLEGEAGRRWWVGGLPGAEGAPGGMEMGLGTWQAGGQTLWKCSRGRSRGKIGGFWPPYPVCGTRSDSREAAKLCFDSGRTRG